MKKSIIITVMAAVIMLGSTSFTSKKTAVNPAYDGYEIIFTGDDIFDPPIKMNFHIYSTPAPGDYRWWKATAHVRMYFLGGGGYWSAPPGAPFRYWIPTWDWGYRNYVVEAAPDRYETITEYDIQDGEALDGDNVTISNWQPE